MREQKTRGGYGTRVKLPSADEFTAMRLLGHTCVQTSAIYANVEDCEARKVVEDAKIVAESLQKEKREAIEASQVIALPRLR